MDKIMKLKRTALSIIIMLTAIFTLSMFSEVYAADSMNLKLVMLRSSNGYGYKALEKNVWKIVQVGSNGTNDYSKTIYCLRGGPGFGSRDESGELGGGNPQTRTYSKSFDMKDPSSIPSPYLSALPDTTSATYKSLLWLLENIYVRPSATSGTEKETAEAYWDVLMEKAEIEDTILEDDVDAVQQMAIWHFTNKDSNYPEYSIPDGGTVQFDVNAIAGSDRDYEALGDNIEDGWERETACKALYKYLVDTATEMGNKGYTPVAATQPYQLAQTTITKTETQDGNNYKIGPFKIEKISETPASLTGIFKNGNTELKNPTLQDANGVNFQLSELQSKVGEEFYLILSKNTNIETITFEISGSYFETTITYWSVTDAPTYDQPVVLVERTKKDYDDTTEYTPEPDKIFDLALRKFIIAVNDNELVDEEGKYLREPVVDPSPLIDGTGTTANYEHPKTPVEVKKGDKVTYIIRVYNEGEVDAIVKEITDYLPNGLEFIPISKSTINRENSWEVSTDGKTVTTRKLAGEVIPAYTGSGEPSHLDVKIECEVIATPGDVNAKLKNIAEITEQTDKDGNEVTDRDSEPETVDPDTYPDDGHIQDDDDYEDLVLPGRNFDLALRKFITKINGVAPEEDREPTISEQEKDDLANSITTGKTTAEKVHPKTPLVVKTGDIVLYTIRVYNEGNVAGYVKEITDYLPNGLEFIPISESTINRENGWEVSADGKTVTTKKLEGTVIPAFDGTGDIPYLDVQIECKVVAVPGEEDINLKNIAAVTGHSDENGDTTVTDRDSEPNPVNPDTYPKDGNIQDDDDYEDLKILGQYFDLALRKFITAVNDDELVDDEGKYLREPVVDLSPLINGTGTTAKYEHPKTPVHVAVGDVVTYTIRVYNEGQIDGYVHEITDHLPEYLEYVNDEFNASYGWTFDEDERTIKTTITSPNTEYSANQKTIYEDRKEGNDKVILEAFDPAEGTLDYIDVKIKCIVKDTGIAQILTNIADISDFSDSEGNDVKDRDSQKDNVTLPSDSTLPDYSDHQQDDDDFEKVIIEKFDLALRKFITKVNDKDITDRVPVFTMDDNKNYKYEHSKTPVEVANADIVVYTIRVYNEGNMAGYAEEVKDDLPEGLEYLPNHEINQEYRWTMYTEDGIETTNVSEAKDIRTDYLSKAQEDETGRDNLLKAFDTSTMTMPDYRDVKIAFRVSEPNTSDRILINIAEITEDADENGDPVEDVDSKPDNDKPGEDDRDEEKVKVKYFDLSLKKIISKVTVILDGKTTVTETKHKFDVEPEPVVKLELKTHTIENAVIKFTYQIRVTNEGEIEGYVKEIRDYIPEGLRFVEEDNKNWTLSEDGKSVTTDQLKDTLLQPGESKIVEVTFRWINGHNNLGLKTNVAEISDDYNDYGDTDDIDSTPDNNKKGEDDIDDASVVLSVVTGSTAGTYIVLATGMLAILSGGLILIKKFVI